MHLKRTRNKYATKRANTLRPKKQRTAGTPRYQRSGITTELRDRVGYDWLPTHKSIYTYEMLQIIRNNFIALATSRHIPYTDRKIDKMRIDSESFMEVERQVYQLYLTRSEERDFATRFESIGMFDAGQMGEPRFNHLSNKPAVAIRRLCTIEPEGCFLMRTLIRRPNKRIIYALAMMEQFLEVYMWDQVETHEKVEQVIDYMGCGWQYDDGTGKQSEGFDRTNWRDRKETFTLPAMQDEVNLSDLARLEQEWKRAETDVHTTFRRTLLHTPLKQVEKWMNDFSNDGSLFLRGVMYLFVNGFKLTDYREYLDVEDYCLPIQESYGMLWDTDDYLQVIDEYSNSHYEGGLSSIEYTEYYFDNGCLRPAGSDHLNKIRVFAKLFNFNTTKRKFDNEKNNGLQTDLPLMRSFEWTGLLHRAINNIGRQSYNRMEANERRVYP